MAEPSPLTITEEIKYNKITQPLLSSPLLSNMNMNTLASSHLILRSEVER